MAARMMTLALARPGCLGAESIRDEEGFGITVSSWRDEAGIAAWKAEGECQAGQPLGRERWYSRYEMRVAPVERACSGPEGREKAHRQGFTPD